MQTAKGGRQRIEKARTGHEWRHAADVGAFLRRYPARYVQTKIMQLLLPGSQSAQPMK